MNLYQHAKNDAVLWICSGDIKILQSDWLRAFWPISQEKDFSKYRICARTQQIIQIFIIEQIQWKLMTNFSLDSKNPIFCPFP